MIGVHIRLFSYSLWVMVLWSIVWAADRPPVWGLSGPNGSREPVDRSKSASEAVECFPGSPRPAASSGARCTLLIILSTSSIQTYSGNTRSLIARDPFFTYCCTSSAWLRGCGDFLYGGRRGEKRANRQQQHRLRGSVRTVRMWSNFHTKNCMNSYLIQQTNAGKNVHKRLISVEPAFLQIDKIKNKIQVALMWLSSTMHLFL